jgi:hypothetical protein
VAAELGVADGLSESVDAVRLSLLDHASAAVRMRAGKHRS